MVFTTPGDTQTTLFRASPCLRLDLSLPLGAGAQSRDSVRPQRSRFTARICHKKGTHFVSVPQSAGQNGQHADPESGSPRRNALIVNINSQKMSPVEKQVGTVTLRQNGNRKRPIGSLMRNARMLKVVFFPRTMNPVAEL